MINVSKEYAIKETCLSVIALNELFLATYESIESLKVQYCAAVVASAVAAVPKTTLSPKNFPRKSLDLGKLHKINFKYTTAYHILQFIRTHTSNVEELMMYPPSRESHSKASFVFTFHPLETKQTWPQHRSKILIGQM